MDVFVRLYVVVFCSVLYIHQVFCVYIHIYIYRRVYSYKDIRFESHLFCLKNQNEIIQKESDEK